MSECTLITIQFRRVIIGASDPQRGKAAKIRATQPEGGKKMKALATVNEVQEYREDNWEIIAHIMTAMHAIQDKYCALLPKGWRAIIEYQSPDNAYLLDLQATTGGGDFALAKKRTLQETCPKKQATGGDDITYIRELIEKKKIMIPNSDCLGEIRDLTRAEDLTYDQHCWLADHLDYCNLYGALRVPLEHFSAKSPMNKEDGPDSEIVISFDGASQYDVNVMFSLMILERIQAENHKLYGNTIWYDLSSLREIPVVGLWISQLKLGSLPAAGQVMS